MVSNEPMMNSGHACNCKPSKGGSKMQNDRFASKKCTCLEESLLQSFFVWKLLAAQL